MNQPGACDSASNTRPASAPAGALLRGPDGRFLWPCDCENTYGHRKRFLFFLSCIRDLFAARPAPQGPRRVLDVGCGTGVAVSLPLAREGFEVLGIDLDPSSIEWAQAHNPYPNARFLRAPLEELVARGERWPAIVCSEVLEHLADPLPLLASLRSALEPGGALLISVPNGYGWFEFEQWLYRTFRMERPRWNLMWDQFTRLRRWRAWGESQETPQPLIQMQASLAEGCPHVQRFRCGRVRRLFSAAGYEVVKFRKNVVWCGSISERILGHSRWFKAFDGLLADCLPACCAAGWYFRLRAREG